MSAAPSGYSVALTFDHASLVLAGKSLGSGDDVRVAFYNGLSWVELDRLLDPASSWNSATTTVWFKTQAAIGAGSSDSNYFLYYGNPAAVSPPANGMNVFLFHDEFPGSAIDVSKWSVTRGSATVSAGLMTLQSDSSVWATAANALGTNTRWESRLRLSSAYAIYFNYWGASDGNGYAGDGASNWITFWADDTQHWIENAAFGSESFASFVPASPTSFHEYRFDRRGTTSVNYYQDSTLVGSLATDVPSAALRAFMWNDNFGQTQIYDWVRVRRYVSPEPTTSLGIEEAASGYCSPTATPTPTDTPTATATSTVTPTATPTATSTATNTPTPTATPTPTPTATSTPTSTPASGATYWLYDDNSPMMFMMYPSQPAGSSSLATGTTSFYSDTIPAGDQISAGTTTVYANVRTASLRTITVRLYGGASILGSTTWDIDTGGVTQLLSTSFATSSYTFDGSERLRLEFNGTFGAFPNGLYWDGAYNDSRVVVPSITTPTPTPTATAAAAPVVDAVSAGDTRPATLTISHTTGSGTDRLMLVGISFVNDQTETVTSVTYDGVPLTKVGERNSSDDARVEIWYLTSPPSGTYNVVITFSAPLGRAAVAGVMTFTGVNQSTPLGTFASASLQCSAPCADPSVNVTSAVNELVFDTVACETCTTLTVGAGQTQRWNLAPLDGPRPSPGAGSTESGAATVTMSWTMGTDDHWAIGAVPIKPSGASPPAVDNTSSGRTPPRTSLTISHATTGSNRLILVGVSLHNYADESVSGITYNGVPLILVDSRANATDARVEIWYLIAPPTGPANVVITFGTELSSHARAGVMTFTGVNQSTPLGTFAWAIGSTSPATINVTSAANELVFDTVASEAQSEPFTLTVGAGQTERWNSAIMGYDRFLGAGSTEPGAASVTMSWSITPASSVPWAIGAVPIKP